MDDAYSIEGGGGECFSKLGSVFSLLESNVGEKENTGLGKNRVADCWGGKPSDSSSTGSPRVRGCLKQNCSGRLNEGVKNREQREREEECCKEKHINGEETWRSELLAEGMNREKEFLKSSYS